MVSSTLSHRPCGFKLSFLATAQRPFYNPLPASFLEERGDFWDIPELWHLGRALSWELGGPGHAGYHFPVGDSKQSMGQEGGRLQEARGEVLFALKWNVRCTDIGGEVASIWHVGFLSVFPRVRFIFLSSC